jgi:hypothetical protein
MERENLRLHRENEQLKLEVQVAQIREEIVMVMPHILKPRARPDNHCPQMFPPLARRSGMRVCWRNRLEGR